MTAEELWGKYIGRKFILRYKLKNATRSYQATNNKEKEYIGTLSHFEKYDDTMAVFYNAQQIVGGDIFYKTAGFDINNWDFIPVYDKDEVQDLIDKLDL